MSISLVVVFLLTVVSFALTLPIYSSNVHPVGEGKSSSCGDIYCFQWDGVTASTEWTYPTGGAVYSSAAIGDVDGDGSLEILVGSNDGNVYSIRASGTMEWSYPTGGAVFSSPALADAENISQYAKDWRMFRNNPSRTGLYGRAPPTHLDVYVGADSGYLYLLEGDNGSLIDRFQVYTGPSGSIHTSPSVADIDGDYRLEIVFYDWGNGSTRGGHTFWCIEDSDPRLLVEEWRFPMFYYEWGCFGSSPAIADLGPDVNNNGSEPDSDLEITTGSDEECNYYWELGGEACGIWRCLDSGGNLEWAKDTETDEARSSPAVIDIDGDGDLEIAAGTTSGWYVEVMNCTGGFVWTFPTLTGVYVSGPFVWPSSPAVADVDPSVSGLEVIIGNRWLNNTWAFDGDNTDGIDDGITITTSDYPWGYPLGTEGTDWDVLWKFDTGNEVWSSPAVGDVDNDGTLEVVIGSTDGNVYVLDGSSGSLEHAFLTGGAVYASAALANLDGDAYLEIVIGSTGVGIRHDVAVTNVTFSKTVVGQGYCMNITVTVENQGNFTEWFGVVAPYFGGEVIPTPEQWETFWSMGDVNRDGHIDQTDADIIYDNQGWKGPPGENPADINSDGAVNVADLLECGYNRGKDIWTHFGLPLPPKGTQRGAKLHPSNQTTLTFNWNTTGFDKGNYTITAYANPVPGETDIADNNLTDGTVLVTFPGDVNGDGKVRIDDVLAIALAFGSDCGDPDYDIDLDITNDCKIRIDDILIAALHFGEGP